MEATVDIHITLREGETLEGALKGLLGGTMKVPPEKTNWYAKGGLFVEPDENNDPAEMEKAPGDTPTPSTKTKSKPKSSSKPKAKAEAEPIEDPAESEEEKEAPEADQRIDKAAFEKVRKAAMNAINNDKRAGVEKIMAEYGGGTLANVKSEDLDAVLEAIEAL